MTTTAEPVRPLVTGQDVAHFHEKGWLRVPAVFTAEETAELAVELDEMIRVWSLDHAWTGNWREQLLDAELAATISLRVLHDLQLYSPAWARAVVNPRLASVLEALLGPQVEFHHTTMHVKAPEKGAPFPTHQDSAFYRHADGRYVDVLLHLDDTNAENGEIRFLDGTHRFGPLQHIETFPDGTPCEPYLPVDEYRLEDTVAVPAKAGDIVCFNINTIHGSYLNRTAAPRRLVRMGYRHPENRQLTGQALGRPSPMVVGVRERGPDQQPFL